MRAIRFLGISFMACLPLGCANWPSATSPSAEPEFARQSAQKSAQKSAQQSSQMNNELSIDESRALQLFATDFVAALQQLPSMSPSSTTVQLLSSAAADPFTVQMRDALQRAGYGTRWVDEGSHAQLFQYRHEHTLDDASTPHDLYEIAIGQVELRRRYATGVDRRTSPASPLYVRGADASQVRIDESHFDTGNPPVQRQAEEASRYRPASSASARQQRSAAAAPSSVRQPLMIAPEASPLNPLISGASRQRELSLPLVALPRIENVFELGGSNYEQLLADHQVVLEQVLTFANDSLRLGTVNKHLVSQMVESFRADSDVFSVIGCSLGPTQLKSGNAALALGRASRVREALLFAGVPQDRILDEGCWAGDSSGNELPRRGVVVTLNRQA